MRQSQISQISQGSQDLLKAYGFRLRKRYRSGVELWKGCLDLYIQPGEPPTTVPELLKLCWQVGCVVGQDTERLRISREFDIELDDLVFGEAEE